MRKTDLRTVFEANNRNYIEFLYNKVDELATELINKKYPQHKQINASLGLYDISIVENMREYIKTIVRISKILKSKINDGLIKTSEEINEDQFRNYM